MRPSKPIDEAAARADARVGMSASEIAKAYGIGYGRAGRIVREARGGASEEAAEHGSPDTGDQAENETGESASNADEACWTLQTTIPEGRLDWLIGNLSHDDAIAALLWLGDQEKADVYQFILQRTIDRMIEPPNPPDLQDLARHLEALSAPLLGAGVDTNLQPA